MKILKRCMHDIYLYFYIIQTQEEECCCNEIFVYVSCMNGLQLKCMEMLLQNSLYFLEHCIPLRDQYILGSYCKLTHSSIFVYNIQLKLHTFVHNNISVLYTVYMFAMASLHPNCIEHGLKPVCKYQVCTKS